ncbi:CLUMA_CG001017, isoform A [Clunio marinus]|uniref:CLUMA_CG001017, isoform A n=1 Tax=Clunio marinus TaxID=568069 RepID=A0A1J1HGT8_9DIPT|nr:CLUMA_CG001017, isoform A [Clunio marinus]
MGCSGHCRRHLTAMHTHHKELLLLFLLQLTHGVCGVWSEKNKNGKKDPESSSDFQTGQWFLHSGMFSSSSCLSEENFKLSHRHHHWNLMFLCLSIVEMGFEMVLKFLNFNWNVLCPKIAFNSILHP